MSGYIDQQRGIGALWQGGVRVADADYRLVLVLNPDGQPYEITGSVVANVVAGEGYVLELADGGRLPCALAIRLGLPQYFTIMGTGPLEEARGA